MIIDGAIKDDKVRSRTGLSEAADSPNDGIGGGFIDIDFAIVHIQTNIVSAYTGRSFGGLDMSSFSKKGRIVYVLACKVAFISIGDRNIANFVPASRQTRSQSTTVKLIVIRVGPDNHDIQRLVHKLPFTL